MMTISTTTDLIRAAAQALIRRDTLAIEELSWINDGRVQSDDDAEAQRLLLRAIHEAACWLMYEPSNLKHDETEQ